MFQPNYSEDINGQMFIEVAPDNWVPSWQCHIVADGVRYSPDQRQDNTGKVLESRHLALLVEDREYPIPRYADISDENVKAVLETMLYPE